MDANNSQNNNYIVDLEKLEKQLKKSIKTGFGFTHIDFNENKYRVSNNDIIELKKEIEKFNDYTTFLLINKYNDRSKELIPRFLDIFYKSEDAAKLNKLINKYNNNNNNNKIKIFQNIVEEDFYSYVLSKKQSELLKYFIINVINNYSDSHISISLINILKNLENNGGKLKNEKGSIVITSN